MKKIKTGILGGTFDPIHKGHIFLAYQAKREHRLDEVWFMPAGDPYFKDGDKVTRAELRMEMTEACVDEFRPDFDVCDYEIRHDGPSYSSETMMQLSGQYPEREFYFIVGRDSLLNMERWYHVEDLFNSCVILCADRTSHTSGNEEKNAGHIPAGVEERLGPDASIEEITAHLKRTFPAARIDVRRISGSCDITSTQIRNAVRNGEDISCLVLEPAAYLIAQEGLYL